MTDAEFARSIAERVQSLERRVQRLEAREGLESTPLEVPEDEIVALLQQNRKIEAVKLYTEITGAGLGDAKAAVDQIEANYLAGG